MGMYLTWKVIITKNRVSFHSLPELVNSWFLVELVLQLRYLDQQSSVGLVVIMKKASIIYVLILLLFGLGLTGCQRFSPPPDQEASPPAVDQALAPSPSPTLTLTPTLTPTPTQTPTPTLTPTPPLLVLPGTPLPMALVPISAGNASQVSALAAWPVEAVNDLAWTSDSSLLAVATGKQIELFDVYSRTSLRSLYPASPEVVSIAFSTDFFGTWLAAGSRWGSETEGYNSAVELWRGPDWQPRGLLSASPRGLNEISFSPTGKLLAAVYSSPVERENLIELLDTTRWTISSTLQAGSVLQISFSPDSAFLATSPDRYSVKIWDINRRTLAYKFSTSFSEAVNSLAYSPDGALLATGSYAGLVSLWDTKTGLLVRSIQADAAVESLAFSPDGRVLATGSGFEDNLVRLWLVDTGELVRELEGHTQGVNQLLFSPDGQWLVSGSYAGELFLWGIRP